MILTTVNHDFRYELEKRVMSGDLAVKDLPAEWNRLYLEYLGVEVLYID